VLDGTVAGRCMQRHLHREFNLFLNAVVGLPPADYATRKHPKVLAWLARAPSALDFDFTAASAPGSSPSRASFQR
jgi:hypothetical protein